MKPNVTLYFLLSAFCAASSCSAARPSSQGRRAAEAPVAATATAEQQSAGGEQQSAGGAMLRLAGSVALAQVRGRIDHMAVDLKGQRLFVAALGNNTVEVVDLKKGERAASVPGFDEPQGLAFVPESGTLVVADGGDGVVTFLDTNSLKPSKRVRLGTDADNVRYDAARRRVYVGYGEGALAVLSAEGERVGDVQLGGHPESFQSDGARVYVNVPSRREIVVVDTDKLKVTGTWTVADASANFPMALDAARHRLFVVTRRPQRLLVYDTVTGKLLSAAEAGGDSDDIFYDAARGRIYASFGEGVLFIYDQTDADHCRLAERVATAAGARTSLFSTEMGRLFVAVPARGDRAAQIMIYQVGP